MKSKLLYAPMLLALSAACGKTNTSSLDAVSANPNVSSLVSKIYTSDAAKKAVQNLEEVSTAAASGASVIGAAANNAPVVAAPTADETLAGEPVAGANPFALPATLATGNPVIDGICNKSFASIEALLFAGDVEGYKAIGLTPAENNTCITQISNYGMKTLDDLRNMGRQFQFTVGLYNASGNPTGARVTFLAHRDYAAQVANPEAAQILYLYLDLYRNQEDLYQLPAALEDVRLTQEEIAALIALPPESLTSDNVQRLNALQGKLSVVQRTLTKTQTRLNRYISLMNSSQFAYYATILTPILLDPSVLNAPAVGEEAPVEPETNAPVVNTPVEQPVVNTPVEPAQPAPNTPVQPAPAV